MLVPARATNISKHLSLVFASAFNQEPGVPIFVEHWGVQFAIFPQFFPIVNIGGMNLNHDFVQMSKLSEDQKIGLHQKYNTFFPEFKWTPIRSHAHQSQIIGADADVDHTQTIGGDTVKLLGGYIPPSPRVSAPLHGT